MSGHPPHRPPCGPSKTSSLRCRLWALTPLPMPMSRPVALVWPSNLAASLPFNPSMGLILCVTTYSMASYRLSMRSMNAIVLSTLTR